jgi:hypothetical protein
MSSSVFAKKASPTNKRRSPFVNETNHSSSSRPTRNKRSLSDRLRSMFRKGSSSKTRASNNQRSGTTSPARSTIVNERPSSQLRAPTVDWSTGHKPSTLSYVPADGTMTMRSARIDRSETYGNDFHVQTPEVNYIGGEQRQPATHYNSRTTMTTTTGFHDHTTIDSRYQQVNSAITHSLVVVFYCLSLPMFDDEL